MIQYTNLGFTQLEAELIDDHIVNQRQAGTVDRAYTLTEEGACLHPAPDTWDKRFYVSLIARTGNYSIALDTGYGTIFLIDTEAKEVSSGREYVTIGTPPRAIVPDAEYYGFPEWVVFERKV